MSESSHAADKASSPDVGRPFSPFSKMILRGVLYSAVVAALTIVAYVGYRAVEEQSSLRQSQDRMMAHIGLIRPVSKRLAPSYRDADGNLTADPPSDPSSLIDPPELVVAHFDGDDDSAERVDWDGFRAHLSAATGKTVTCQPYLNTAEDAAAVKAGRIHVVALHAADVPYLVNNAGFVPVAVLGSDATVSGNHLVIAVGATSKIRSLAEIRGRTLTCTRPDSITGYRAAVAVLSYDAGLLPHVDYQFHFSHGQSRSIRGLLESDFEIAALSGEKLQSMLADGSLKSSNYRAIYESQVIPRLTFGHVHNLVPELAAQVTKSALEFDNAGAAENANEGRMRFFAMDYRKDFVFPRKIDDSFDPRITSTTSQGP